MDGHCLQRFSYRNDLYCFQLPLIIDVNECASTPCEGDGTCVDLVDGYRCTCVEGLLGANCHVSK